MTFDHTNFLNRTKSAMAKSTYLKIPDDEENRPSFLSNITCSWLTPLFKTASQRPLEQDDLPNLFGQIPSKLTFEKYQRNWKAEKKTKNPKLWRVILKSMEWRMLLANIACSFLASSFQILLPVLLFLLLKECNAVEQHNKLWNDTISQGNQIISPTTSFIKKINLPIGMYIIGISLVSFFGNYFKSEVINIGCLQGTTIQSGLISLIYNKVMFSQPVFDILL